MKLWKILPLESFMIGNNLAQIFNPLVILNNLSKPIDKATKILSNSAKNINLQILKIIANQKKINYLQKGQSKK